MARRNTIDDLWSRVEKTDTCWLWTGYLQSGGYGQIWLDGSQPLVHRLAYETLVGPIPEGLTIDHLCRVRRCVNPSHLEPVTIQENLRRAWELRPCGSPRVSTHCVNGHLWTPETTYERRGFVECRTCNNESCRRYRERRRSAA